MVRRRRVPGIVPAAEMRKQMTGIIILNYQTWETSLKCMKSAARSMEGGAYAVYLVDNASTEPMPDAVKQYIDRKSVV